MTYLCMCLFFMYCFLIELFSPLTQFVPHKWGRQLIKIISTSRRLGKEPMKYLWQFYMEIYMKWLWQFRWEFEIFITFQVYIWSFSYCVGEKNEDTSPVSPGNTEFITFWKKDETRIPFMSNYKITEIMKNSIICLFLSDAKMKLTTNQMIEGNWCLLV